MSTVDRRIIEAEDSIGGRAPGIESPVIEATVTSETVLHLSVVPMTGMLKAVGVR